MNKYLIAAVLLISGGLASSAVQAAAPEWPQFRGPDGQGHAAAKHLPITWSESENVVWRAEIPGRGWSSPVIAGDEIWLTTGIESPITQQEKQRRLANNTGNQPLTVSGPLSMRAVCVDRTTGEVKHNIELMVEPEPDWTHSLNTFASPTPVLEEGRLYCHFGTHGTACLDTRTRQVLWTNRTLKVQHENGAGSSPVLFGDVLIFHCDGSDVQYIVALDKNTGQVAWRRDRSGAMNENPQLKKAYGTPLIISIDGRPVLVSPAADWLYGYEPATGSELWKVNYGRLGFSIVPRPVAGHGMVYMCTSFMQSELLAVRVDDSQQPAIAWQFAKQAPNMSSPLLVGDELYLVSDKGVATCLDAHTGEAHWTERLPGNYSSSPLYADGKIYIGNREGQTVVLSPGTQFQQLAVNQLDGPIMASPAALEDSLYVRTERSLYRLAESLPLVTSEDFEQGADRWEPTDPDAWKVIETERGKVYSQHKKMSNYQPPYRSPFNLSLLKDVVVGDFQVTARVRSTHPDYGHRDVCLAFGFQGPGNYYYVHLGKQADDHANQIFIVDGAPRKKISLKSTDGTDWDDAWHRVRIVRKVADGTIEVYFDDMQNPVMLAKDKTFTSGRIGLGSFDDTSDWDDIELRGVVVEKAP